MHKYVDYEFSICNFRLILFIKTLLTLASRYLSIYYPVLIRQFFMPYYSSMILLFYT